MEKLFWNKNSHNSKKHGFGMVEAMVGVALSLIIILAFTTLAAQAIKLNRYSDEKLRAIIYLQELIEIAKDLELSKNWDELTNGHCLFECYPDSDITPGKWSLIPGEETFDGYTRLLKVTDVYRTCDKYKIVSEGDEGALLDPGTKKITARIFLEDSTEPLMELETYVYNYSASLICP